MPASFLQTTPAPTDTWPREPHASSTCAGASAGTAASTAMDKEEQEERERRRAQRAKTPPAIPGYELLRIIGKGAYGEVWLARERTGEYRAIKVVWREDFKHPELYEQELIGTLLYEPLSQGTYGLVPILQVGHHEQEYFFCVMELADHSNSGSITDPETYRPRTLQSVMNSYGRRPIPLDPVLGVGIHLAHGLARLHDAGLTHCDIKPSNIVYVRDVPSLTDAGMVSPPGKRTCSGTEGYIPPEGPGSKQADIYALALVLYEMATGCDRHDFPTLPVGLPEGNERWLDFNRIICAAADPVPTRRRITSATQLGRRLEALRHPPVFLKSQQKRWDFRPWLAALAVAALLAFLLVNWLMPDGYIGRMPHAWDVLMGNHR